MKNITKTNILFTFIVALYLLVVFIVQLIPPKYIGINARMVIPELILLLPAFVYVTYMKPESLRDMSFRMPKWSIVVLTLFATFLIMPLISLINMVSTIFVENHVVSTMDIMSGNPLIVNLFTMAVLPAICEEYIFRGIIFHSYKRRNPFKGMLLSSLLFGLIHMNVNQFIYAFLMGCIFCLLVYATGSIMSSIAAHMFFNGYNVIISTMAADILAESESLGVSETIGGLDVALIIAYGFTIVRAIAFGVAACIVFKVICDKTCGFEKIKLMFCKGNRCNYVEGEGKFIDLYLLVGIGLCVGYIVAYGL